MFTIEFNTTFEDYPAGQDTLDGVVTIKGTRWDWDITNVFIRAGKNNEVLVPVHNELAASIRENLMSRPLWVDAVDEEHKTNLPRTAKALRLVPAWAE